jgi:hypothetical protein
MNQQMNKCLIRESLEIRTAINDVLRKNNISSRQLLEKAKSERRKFSESQLSRYRKHGHITGGLQSSDVVWICNTINIDVTLKIKKKKFNPNL